MAKNKLRSPATKISDIGVEQYQGSTLRQMDFIDATIERQLLRMQIDLKILYARINALNDRMTILHLALGNRSAKSKTKDTPMTLDMFAG
jgi:hypothetical protein